MISPQTYDGLAQRNRFLCGYAALSLAACLLFVIHIFVYYFIAFAKKIPDDTYMKDASKATDDIIYIASNNIKMRFSVLLASFIHFYNICLSCGDYSNIVQVPTINFKIEIPC